MNPFIAMLGAVFILFILLDVFQFIVLPRRVSPQVSLARLFIRLIGYIWRGIARQIRNRSRRESFLSFFGPLALILLFALWAVGLVLGFGLLGLALGSQYKGTVTSGFLTDLYASATSFFTLGFADITPGSAPERALSVLEAALGFGFLGLVISYLPLFYQSFAGREVLISMLDEWAGSPPSAGELLRRLGEDQSLASLDRFLQDWEAWAAELLESHLSYPILGVFRSQHENQSWLAGLTMVLDLCALVSVGIDGEPRRSGRLTFAIARHAVGDLTQVYDLVPRAPQNDRLPPADLVRLRGMLEAAGIRVREGPEADGSLTELRAQYEPYVNALADFLLMDLPPWFAAPGARDNWQTTAWSRNGESHLRT
jgi:hypothetical protein